MGVTSFAVINLLINTIIYFISSAGNKVLYNTTHVLV